MKAEQHRARVAREQEVRATRQPALRAVGEADGGDEPRAHQRLHLAPRLRAAPDACERADHTKADTGRRLEQRRSIGGRPVQQVQVESVQLQRAQRRLARLPLDTPERHTVIGCRHDQSVVELAGSLQHGENFA